MTKEYKANTNFRAYPGYRLLSLWPEESTFYNSTATTFMIDSPLREIQVVTSDYPQAEYISEESLRNEVVDMFKTRQVLYPSDVAMAFDVDYERALAVFDGLRKDGAIEPASKSGQTD